MTQSLLINGKWQTGKGDIFKCYNPATGALCWQGRYANKRQADIAVTVAKLGFSTWRKVPLEHRQKILKQYAKLLAKNKKELATLIALETGKPLWESETEVESAIGKITISIDAYQDRTGHKMINQSPYVGFTHKPHGVFIVLGPYNFPLHLPNGHIVPALLAGNSIVFKPSHYTPRTGLKMIELLLEAGVPEAVISVILGNAQIGEYLLKNDSISGVLFTGSYQTGQYIHRQFAGKVDKILALEMGGNNPLVVWDINNIEAACYQIIVSSYISAGQRCTCARRLILPNNQFGDKLLTRLVEKIQKIKISSPETRDCFMGPVISHDAANVLLTAQSNLIKRGAKALINMRLIQSNTGLLTPGLIDITHVKHIPDEELFGPLLQVTRVDSFMDAIWVANNTSYGLAAGLLSDDKKNFELFFSEVNAGIINYNKQLTGASSKAPFGGVGFSGNHHPSAFYAADYCAYPVASMQCDEVEIPQEVLPGLL